MILPVFAGMILGFMFNSGVAGNSPRIRGDDPDALGMAALQRRFSPYSRG